MTDTYDLPSVNADAFRKFTPDGFPRDLPGISLIHFVDQKLELFARITEFAKRLEHDLATAKLIRNFVFLPAPTFHITILDISLHPTESAQSDIIRGTELFFQKLQSRRPPSPLFRLQGMPYFTNKETLILKAEPAGVKEKEIIESIRNTHHEILAEIAGRDIITPLYEYRPHLTLAYLIEPFVGAEHDSFHQILESYQEADPLGEVLFDTFELRKFASMTDWGNSPLLEASLNEQ